MTLAQFGDILLAAEVKIIVFAKGVHYHLDKLFVVCIDFRFLPLLMMENL